jgi:hypothetical protein
LPDATPAGTGAKPLARTSGSGQSVRQPSSGANLRHAPPGAPVISNPLISKSLKNVARMQRKGRKIPANEPVPLLRKDALAENARDFSPS